MWTAKLTFEGSDALLASRTKKYQINLFAFPLSYSYEKEWVIVHIAGNIVGNKKNIDEFVKELREQKRVINFELNDNFFVGIIKEPIITKTIYNKDIIHLKPALIDEYAKDTITIGSFSRKSLEKAIKTLKDNWKASLNFIKERKINNISIVQEAPELTDKQREALSLAIKHGYYECPRKIELEKLAKLMKLSYSTYQVHLRKAEQKLLPFFFNK